MKTRITATESRPESMLVELVRSVVYTAVTVVVLGLAYPACVTLIASIAFPHQAEGSLVIDNSGKVRGSALTGQLFTSAKYFQGRPSAAGNGYDPLASSGTNLGPTSKKLIESVKTHAKSLAHDNPHAPAEIPADLLTSSGSGLDPDISVEAADYQMMRVAQTRSESTDKIRALVDANIIPRTFGFLGEPRVNVLNLNRALDAQGVKS
jgi:K+-transporting ATPase ATPase C chain